MTKEKAAQEFRKHYRYACRLKEGGAAWEREMAICEKLKAIVLGQEERTSTVLFLLHVAPF